MIKKITLALSILFIFIIAISAVSAEDNLTAASDEIISQEDETGTFEDLTLELDAVEDGGTYNLTKNYRFESGSTEGIKINKSITINGDNHQLDGNAQSRIFTTYGGNITLNNLVLTNGFADKGGAILSQNKIIFNNVTFINNHADEGGAAYIYINTAENDVQYMFADCVFDGNHAENGAGIYFTSLSILSPEIDHSGDDNYTDSGEEEGQDEGQDEDQDEGQDEGQDEDQDEGQDEEYIVSENILLINTIFRNSYDISKGMIYVDSPILIFINNSTFANSTSEYGTAFFLKVACDLKFNNTSFMNMHSNMSGGAICGLGIDLMTIDNSTFSNVTAENNGGVICIDIVHWDLEFPFSGNVIINKSRFKDSKAKFGGSIVLFGGVLNITDSSFENNIAISGGAVYVAATDMAIKNSTFKNNEIDDTGNGAAINEFRGKLNIKDSFFMDNRKNAIYCSDSDYNITGSYFNNNGEAIHSIYVISCFTDNNNYTNDIVAENTTDEGYYVLIINSTGTALKLIKNEIDVVNIPIRYDSRDFGWITSVKDQNVSGACWVFSTCAGLEAALLKSTGVEYNLSVNNIQKNLIGYSKYGHMVTAESGFISMASKFILSWYGAFSVDYEPFDICGKITMPIIAGDAIHVQDLLCLPAHRNATDNDEIKRAIMKYGAICTDIAIDYNEPFFNNETFSLYFNETEGDANHAICVVGWDDDYPADKFLITAPGNGAWIVKNSYGPSMYDNGYIYVSYYDTKIFASEFNVAFILENTENYNKNYQTDIGGEINILTNMSSYTYKNTYKAIEDDFISAVGTYFESGEEYNLEIYINGQLKHAQTGISSFRGYHTVKLTKNIPIKLGDTFVVAVSKSSMPFVNFTVQHFSKDVSLADWGEGWVDLSALNATATLKAYTKPMVNLTPSIAAANVNTVYNGGKYLTVNVKDVYGDSMKGIKVTVRFSNGAVKSSITDSKGQVKFLMNNLSPKTYTATITTDAFGKYVKASATAKIIVKKASLKLTAKSSSFKVKTKVKKIKITLKDKNGKAVKNAKITLKVNGKTYTAKTNAKGVATVKITKLTKKGTYKATVTFKGDKYYNKATKNVKITIK